MPAAADSAGPVTRPGAAAADARWVRSGMAIARYKDLCVDSLDAHALAAFWAPRLGLEAHPHDDGDACLRSPDGDTAVWVNRVPEAPSVKNRLHLDVNAESVEPFVASGAVLLDDSLQWTVMRDPDGQLFCVFTRDEPVTRRLYELVWDVTGDDDAADEVARWWGGLLGSEVQRSGRGFSWAEPVPGAPFESFVYQAVPEAKQGKNRVHVDVTCDAVEGLVAAGARVLRGRGDDIQWTVMSDPWGNEFCAFTDE